MSDALAAALLASQRKQVDPSENSRRYGQLLLQRGSSTAPVASWSEGLARALTGAAGGFFEGQAEREQKDKQRKTVEGLSAALGAPDAASRVSLLKGIEGDNDIIAPLLGSMLSQQMSDERKATLGQRAYNAAGGAAPGSSGLTINMSPTGSGPPLPSGTPAPGGFANNLGNIRATNLPWDGKGAPQNGFETFNTPQAGANAMAKNLQAYIQQNPNISVAQAIAKWAPPNENDTDLYIRQVAEGTGLNPGMPLGEVMKDQGAAATLMDAITRKEKGGLPPGVSADTFMAAAGPAVPQGSADASGTPQQPAKPTHDPGADYEALGKRAAAAGDWEAATKFQMEANKARAQFGTEQFKEDQKRTADNAEYDRRQVVQNENKLRDDFNSQKPVKDYREAAAVFRSAVDASKVNSAAADLNLVYAFAKLMDPGSVVREGEMGMVTTTQSASDRVKALVAMVNGGQRISPEARGALMNEMASRFEAYKTAHDDMANTFKGISSRIGANPENVIVGYPDVQYERTPAKAAGTPAGPKAGDIIDGYRFKGGDPSKQANWEAAQ